MSHATIRKLTPVLVVDAIEPCLPFWTERLGFEKTVEVPHEDRLGFVILVKDQSEIMYQTRASVAGDVPSLLEGTNGHSIALFLEVSDLNTVEKALSGWPIALPRRKTFYGMDELGVREPGGNFVTFAQQSS